MRTANATVAACLALCVVFAVAKALGLGRLDDLSWHFVLLPLMGIGVGLMLVGAFVVAAISFGALLMLIDDHRASRARKGTDVA